MFSRVRRYINPSIRRIWRYLRLGETLAQSLCERQRFGRLKRIVFGRFPPTLRYVDLADNLLYPSHLLARCSDDQTVCGQVCRRCYFGRARCNRCPQRRGIRSLNREHLREYLRRSNINLLNQLFNPLVLLRIRGRDQRSIFSPTKNTCCRKLRCKNCR